jgi:hypothetical protein
MQSILNRTDSETNLSGIRKLIFIPVTEIDDDELPHAFLTPSDQVIDAATLTTPGEAEEPLIFRVAEFIRGEAAWTTDEESTPSGPLYKERISWTVARDSDTRRTGFDDMEGREFVAIAVDFNEKQTLFGYVNLEGEIKGMRFSKKKTTGAKEPADQANEC